MKKWIALVLALVMCLAMVGCTGNTEESTVPEANNTTAPEESTTAPEESTTAPEESTTAPEESTAPQKINSFSGWKLELGSQMPDFTLRDVDGEQYTLYEMLEEKQMVMFNFWFINCPYCVEEFPYMVAAYEQYSDSMQIMALNPFDSDEDIQEFRAEHGLNFTVCGMDLGMRFAFNVQGYPTTVIVDRNGVVCLVHIGMLPDEETVLNMFAYFTAEEYETKLFEDVSEIGQ